MVWSSTEVLVDTIFTPGPGHVFEIGTTTTVFLEGIDVNGNSSSCTFQVTVPEPTQSLTCNDNVVIELNGVCENIVTPDSILEGGPYGCIDDYSAIILSPVGQNLGNNVNLDFVGTTWTVKITDLITLQSCWGQISVVPDSLIQDITCPSDTTIFCHEPLDTALLGSPYIETCLSPNQIDFTYFDVKDNSYCDGDDISFTVTRNWTATSEYGEYSYCTQVITAVRPEISDFVFPPNYDGIDLPKLACDDSTSPSVLADTSITGIPLVNGLDPFTNACRYSFFVTDSITNVCGRHFEIMREWTVFDNCDDNIYKHTQTIIIADEEGPLFTIPDTIHVSEVFPCGSESILPPIDLLHECSGFVVKIETPWNTHFTNGALTGVPQIPGTYSAIYTVTDSCGNTSSDTAIISVSNIVVVDCPPAVTIFCQEYFNDLQANLDTGNYVVLAPYGYPVFAANCELELIEHVTTNVDSCGNGTIVRDFSTVEGIGSCQQIINVQHVSDFVVEFPENKDIECGQIPIDYGQPALFNNACGSLQVDFTDQIFTDVADACYKIVRTWTVVNPCVVGVEIDQEVEEDSEQALDFSGCLDISTLECDLDGDGDCDNRTFRDSWAICNLPSENEVSNSLSPDTDPDPNPWDGYISYEQVIKVSDTVDPVFQNGCAIPDVCVNTNDCTLDSLILPQQFFDECSPLTSLTASIKINGVWQSGFGPHLDVEIGEYEVRYVANDNCNNQTACETTVKVVDCTPPEITCLTNITVELMFDPFTGEEWVNLFAISLIESYTESCYGNLNFSFHPFFNENEILFNCNDLGLQTVDIWVNDVSGNQNSCTASFVIIPAQWVSDPCYGPNLYFEGTVETEDSHGIEGVTILTSLGINMATDIDGSFVLFPPNEDPVTFTPFLDGDDLNGVTTYDLVLLTKHILGVDPLDSPYKLIAADVNNSGTVTTFDAVTIRKLILFNITEFPDVNSWRFVPKDYIFPDPTNPFVPPFPENKSADPLTSPQVDFIGIKMGDLN